MRARVINFFAIFALLTFSAAAAETPPQPKALRIVMFSGSKEYDSTASLAKLKKTLEQDLHAICTLHEVEEKGTKLEGIEDLDTADVALFFTRRVSLAPEPLARVKKFVASGKAVIGIRTASHGFQTWLEFDREILGGSYNNHYGKDAVAEISPQEKQKDHPILKGITAFKTMGKLYKNPKLADDVALLLTVKTAEATEPAAWARAAVAGTHGRVFYTSLGVPKDFDEPMFQKLLVNAVSWATSR